MTTERIPPSETAEFDPAHVIELRGIFNEAVSQRVIVDPEKSDDVESKPVVADLGLETRVRFRSSMEPENGYPVYRDYETAYPPEVSRAILELIDEYNTAFTALIDKNRDTETEYQYCFGDDGVPRALGLQIDMQALPPEFLEACASGQYTSATIKEVLRGLIFEQENSLAMTPLLERLFARDEDEEIQFKQAMRGMLDGVRERTGKRVVMLAVTEPKHKAILASEFGVQGDETITADQICEHSGFNDVWGPEQYLVYVQGVDSGEISDDVLFYARTSLPVANLKRPDAQFDQADNPLLSDPTHVHFIRERALTPNVDGHAQPREDRINDTKEYMEPLGLGYPVREMQDIYTRPYLLLVALENVQTHVDSLIERSDSDTQEVPAHVALNKLYKPVDGMVRNVLKGKTINSEAFVTKMRELQSYLSELGLTDLVSQIDTIEQAVQARDQQHEAGEDTLTQDIDAVSQLISAQVEELKASQPRTQKEALSALKGAIAKMTAILRNNAQDSRTRENTFEESMDALLDGLTEVGWLGVMGNYVSLTYNELEEVKGNPFQKEFVAFMQRRGISPEQLRTGEVRVRAKPLTESYGCYGHNPAMHPMDMMRLEPEINARGAYILQPEMPQVIVQDYQTGEQYVTIDRNFFLLGPDGKTYLHGGGYRSMAPAQSKEAKERRVHGNHTTKWAPVLY